MEDSSTVTSTVFDIDIECPTAKGLVGLLTFSSDVTWEEFRYAIVKKMNQHMENLSIGFKLSVDDSKKGTRQLEDDGDFEGMVRMLRLHLPNRNARARPITVLIVDLMAGENTGPPMSKARNMKVHLYFVFQSASSFI